MLRMIALGGVVCAVLVGSASAQDHAPANDEEARRVFEAGTHEFDAGRYEQALALFDHAYAMSQRGGLLYNIGLCHDRLGHDREALDAFRRFLAADAATTHRTEVEVRIHALESAVARADAAAQTQTQDHTQTVPTPAETAHIEDRHAQIAPPIAPPPPEHHGSVLEEWWFWTIIGVAVAGGVVAAVLIADANRGTEMPITPVNGLFTALEVP